ncbi:MAG TPA: aminopeptidase P family N-terminal domain-containing protein, partial [Gemmataceae bacterium]|nr:aminopeptidase P family N-terminal domain-containing protein [Gemmataceae bacterium]
MLSEQGCRERRRRLWERLDPKPDSDYLLLTDPLHLMYLANFWVDPFNYGGSFGGALLLRNDGHAKLIHDNRLPESVAQAHVDERRVVSWYDGESPQLCPRQMAPLADMNPFGKGLRVHDRLGDPYAPTVIR